MGSTRKPIIAISGAHESAVDPPSGSSHERRQWTCQEENYRRDFNRLTKPPHRATANKRSYDVGIGASDACRNLPWCNRIHPNPVSAKVDGERMCKPNNGRLRRGIGRRPSGS